ncbi:ComC/BlpC family leader-containing pheromone/bacteriocin [Tenacibaculum sp. 190524A02b]|uniref:ComC/BlpC family leader-containing pheromone/bacteriocin n=1 Tax=Tenacibaculum vairaonense TaxID=3137860 RepID=UPI0031FB31AA
MKLSKLTSFETLNNETVETITGGAADRDSRRNDSETKDCKKGDVFKSKSGVAGQA